MRALSAAAVFAVALAAAAAHAADAKRATAALRLAPTIERIARLQAQAGQGVMAERSRRALAEATRDFGATLRAALANAQGAEVRDNYVLLSMLWQDYREWVQRPPSRETARKLRERTEEVSWVASKGVRLVNDASPNALGGSALRASQAALFSQRVAKAYLWKRWDIRDEGLERELRDARENVPRALEALAATSDLAPDILAQVESAQTQWRFLSDAVKQLDASPGNTRALEHACKAADFILEAMEKVMQEAR
jgi:hypothetical protein